MKAKNLIGFEDFKKNWKPEKAKKTKRTQTGLDIIKENKDKKNISNKEEFKDFILNYMDPDVLRDRLTEQEHNAIEKGVIADVTFKERVAEEVYWGDIFYEYEDYDFLLDPEDAVDVILDFYD